MAYLDPAALHIVDVAGEEEVVSMTGLVGAQFPDTASESVVLVHKLLERHVGRLVLKLGDAKR